MSLVNYYMDGKEVMTGNDLDRQQAMSTADCVKAHYYLAPSPMGWFNELGAEPVGKRPVWKSYEVGKLTCTSPTKYRDFGYYECRQPCWCNKCK